MIKLADFKRKQMEAERILCKAMPGFSFSHASIEVVDFGLGEVDKTGLEILVLANQPSHCGKELIWTPWQFLPEHRHQTVYILDKDVTPPRTGGRMIHLQERNPEFGEGNGELPKRPVRKFNYFLPTETLTAEQESQFANYGTVKKGKSETFVVRYGHGLFLGSSLGAENEGPSKFDRTPAIDYVSDSQKEFYLTYYKRKPIWSFQMLPGRAYTIPTNTPHAVLAGEQGMVATEISSPSWDPADVFTDQTIRRRTKVEMLDGKVVPADARFYKKLGARVIEG